MVEISLGPCQHYCIDIKEYKFCWNCGNRIVDSSYEVTINKIQANDYKEDEIPDNILNSIEI